MGYNVLAKLQGIRKRLGTQGTLVTPFPSRR